MMVEQIFGRLNLTSTEKQIVDFIEANPRIVINLPLDELSEQCYVSQASVIRFCKKLGMKGFADFKIKLASQLSTFAANGQSIHVDMPIGENADGPEIAETFYHLTAQALKTTYDSLDYQALRKAASDPGVWGGLRSENFFAGGSVRPGKYFVLHSASRLGVFI